MMMNDVRESLKKIKDFFGEREVQQQGISWQLAKSPLIFPLKDNLKGSENILHSVFYIFFLH